MAISMYDAENVEFKFSRLRRHLKLGDIYQLYISSFVFECLITLLQLTSEIFLDLLPQFIPTIPEVLLMVTFPC